MLLQSSPRQKPAIDGDGQAEHVGRQFGRLRGSLVAVPETTLAARTPLALPTEALRPPVQPVDSTKTFVGPNGTYYDERWRWMEWRGRNCSWNWAAALTFGGWLAYRRFYALAVVYLAWVGLLTVMVMHGTSLRFAGAVQLVAATIVGLYANRLYQQRFRRAAWRVAQAYDEHGARLDALARLGGVDRRAVWLMALAGTGLAGLLIGLDG